MSVTAKAEGSTRGVGAGGGVYREARQALRSFCPQALLNWREARFYGRYGEVELHLLEFLCSRDKDASMSAPTMAATSTTCAAMPAR